MYETIQTLYIIRHGIAYHNMPIPIPKKSITTNDTSSNIVTYRHPDVRDPKYTDSKLVLPKAHEQARKAGKRLKEELGLKYPSSNDGQGKAAETKENASLDCVFVSPLSRCFETAYFVMDELGKTKIPWVCKEELREAYGIHYSDKRSCRSILQQNWPNVMFDQNMTEEDEAWKPDRRETVHDLMKRIDKFLLCLSWNELLRLQSHSQSNNDHQQYKQQKLLIVTHGVWMECLFHKFNPEVLESGKKRVHNCDLYCADLVCNWEQKKVENMGNVHRNEYEWNCTKISLDKIKPLR